MNKLETEDLRCNTRQRFYFKGMAVENNFFFHIGTVTFSCRKMELKWTICHIPRFSIITFITDIHVDGSSNSRKSLLKQYDFQQSQHKARFPSTPLNIPQPLLQTPHIIPAPAMSYHCGLG